MHNIEARPGPNSNVDDDVEMPVIDALTQAAIGRQLKAHYDELVNAPVPDKFLVLLAKLEARESGGGNGRGGDD